MALKTIICAIAAASFGFASLSFADDDDRCGSERESPRSEQRGDRDRRGHDSDRLDQHKHHGHRGHDRHDIHSERSYGALTRPVFLPQRPHSAGIPRASMW